MSNFDPNMSFLLLPISFLYHFILSIRHKLYDWHLLRSKRHPQPVICVGNLALGGTGKTPHIESLIRLLSDTYTVCVVSRGYGRRTKGFQLAMSNCTAETIGDEPLQLFTKFKDVQIAVDESRNRAIELMGSQDIPPQVYLLDDAFQHRKTEAGLNILLTAFGRLYSQDFLVPAGTLRDVRSAAKRAQIVIVTKVPSPMAVDKAELRKQLKLQEHQKLFLSSLEYEPLKPMNKAALDHEEELHEGVSALCFTGIADPDPLFAHLRETGFETHEMRFADHHKYNGSDIQQLLQHFQALPSQDKIMVTTEKDYARLINSPYLCQFDAVPIFVAPVQVRFQEEEKFNNEILSYVRKNSQHS